MVNIHELSASFMAVSTLVAISLLFLAIKAYRQSRDPSLAFVGAAFTLFSVKSLIVGYALLTGSIQHTYLELVDAVGDLGTVVLFVIPIFWAPGQHTEEP